MPYVFEWLDVDVTDPSFNDEQQLVMRRLLEKMSQYVRQGRLLDAHGVGAAIMIVFHLFKGVDPFEPEEANTAQVPL